MAGIGGSISGGSTIGRLGLIGLMGLFAVSCGASFQWAGTWTGKRNLSLPKGGDPSILATISKVELKIEENGRFELFEGGVHKSGTVRSEGRQAFLRVTHFLDRPIEAQGEAAVKMNQEILLSAQKDGSVIFTDPAGIADATVRLRREKSESQR